MTTFANYSDVRNFLDGTTDFEKMVRSRMKREAFDLGRVSRFFDALGAPQTAYECIHIAGTTGKGSTTWLMDALLRAHGYATGRYTSPHLEHETERIAINGENISTAELTAVFNDMAPVLGRFQSTGDALTYFEIMTGAALVAFRRAHVQFAVLETGLGGRLDATNAVMPALTMITTIDYDHMDKLGETLADIAYEKAGIIKSDVPLITGNYDREALDVVLKRARELEMPVRRLDSHFRVRNVQPREQGFTFNVSGSGYDYQRLVMHEAGYYQAVNAALAIEGMHQLAIRGILAEVREDTVRQALEQIHIPGRCEIPESHPRVMLDAAHNVESIRHTLKTFMSRFKTGHKVLLFAAASDKDIEGMVKVLAGHFDEVIITEIQSARALPVERHTSYWQKYGATPRLVPVMGDALAAALDAQGTDGAVLITGSFYLAGPLRAKLLARA